MIEPLDEHLVDPTSNGLFRHRRSNQSQRRRYLDPTAINLGVRGSSVDETVSDRRGGSDAVSTGSFGASAALATGAGTFLDRRAELGDVRHVEGDLRRDGWTQGGNPYGVAGTPAKSRATTVS